MKRKLVSLGLALVICLSLTIPAAAAEQRITVNGESYEQVLRALLAQTEDAPVTLRLETDIQLVNDLAIVLGSSDYGGLFGGEVITVPSHDITIDLNGHTLTSNSGYPAFEVESGYSLTVVDSSVEQSGKLVSDTGTAVEVREGGAYTPLFEQSGDPAAEQRITVNGESYEQVLRALLAQTEDAPVTLRLETDIQLVNDLAIVLGSSDYGGLFGGEVITVPSHDITIDLNGHTLTSNSGYPAFEVESGYSLTVVDSSAEQSGKLVSDTGTAVEVREGGAYTPLSE